VRKDVLQVSRIKLSRVGVDVVVRNDHLVVRGDEVDVDVVRDGEVSVHAHESSEGPVDRVVAGNRVESNVVGVSHEVLIVARLDLNGGVEGRRKLSRRSSSTSAEEGCADKR
jgi:hypothetical protein